MLPIDSGRGDGVDHLEMLASSKGERQLIIPGGLSETLPLVKKAKSLTRPVGPLIGRMTAPVEMLPTTSWISPRSTRWPSILIWESRRPRRTTSPADSDGTPGLSRGTGCKEHRSQIVSTSHMDGAELGKPKDSANLVDRAREKHRD